VPAIYDFWPEAKNNIHIDAWREVNFVNDHKIIISERKDDPEPDNQLKLFFLNLGGYRKNEFDELHYKMLVAAPDSSEAIKTAKKTLFYKEAGFKGAASHVDDKYALDVDDIYSVEDILDPVFKNKYRISIEKTNEVREDEIHLGYLQLWKIKS
jgi:hypothetical protein